MPTYFYCNQTEQFTLVSYISALLSIIYATTDEAYVLQIFFVFFCFFRFFRSPQKYQTTVLGNS